MSSPPSAVGMLWGVGSLEIQAGILRVKGCLEFRVKGIHNAVILPKLYGSFPKLLFPKWGKCI